MSEPAGENGRITYTVKELLGKLDAKLDYVIAQLADKADAHDLEDLQKRVTVLEGSAATETQLKAYRRWLLVFGTSTVLALLTVAVAVARQLLGG
jgi:hypothetical protein